jgi:hypothetical protein
VTADDSGDKRSEARYEFTDDDAWSEAIMEAREETKPW